MDGQCSTQPLGPVVGCDDYPREVKPALRLGHEMTERRDLAAKTPVIVARCRESRVGFLEHARHPRRLIGNPLRLASTGKRRLYTAH
jgi:hypothetical protein